MFNIVRVFICSLRLVGVVFSTIFHASLLVLCPDKMRGFRLKVLKSWGWSLYTIVGISVHVEGHPAKEGVILISNHRSYMDIPILMGLSPCVFLAKAELQNWPVIGWAATVARTVFVDRNNLESRTKSRETLRERLSEGLSVLIFAEGTTIQRGDLRPLKPGMFHEAAEAQLPIQLVCIEVEKDEDAWTDNARVGQHFFSRFGYWRTYVFVRFQSGLIRGGEGEGAHMCTQAEEWLRTQITELNRR